MSNQTYRLALAEKPSVAKAIAAVLGATERRDGYFSGNGWLVSWCYGHLVELAAPSAYGESYKRWNRAALPILPEPWQFKASGDKKKQIDTLRSLMNRADVEAIINCCDAGREGELIFRLVYDYCGCKKPTHRLWISSLEDSAIRAGFDNLRPGSDYDSLYRAALCRSKADWLVGINATRLFSCLYGSTLNVGRVQSPTLAMLTEREAAVAAFAPAPFYTPELDCGRFTESGERFTDKSEAERIRAACDGKSAVVLLVEKTQKTLAPPKLFDLTSLQREANKAHGFTAQQTLDYAQSLYEKKLATYPRTDSRYITADMTDTVLKLIGGADFTPNVAALVGAVSDHHAILPTLTAATADLRALPSGEQSILQLLQTRLLQSVGEPHIYAETTITLDCDRHCFTAKGKTVIQQGWKTASEDDYVSLPELAEGQSFDCVAITVKEGKTVPPKRFTDGTLLRAMETASAEDFPDDAERLGLGTPATRAGIIEKLIKSGFAERRKKLLVPTQKGVNLCAILPEELKSPLLTAEWEQRLCEVQSGELSDAEFMAGIAALVSGLVPANTAPLAEYAALFAAPPKGAVIGKCPRCGADVTESGKGFFCSSRACKFALWKDSRFFAAKGKTLDKDTAAALLSGERVFFSDLKSEKTGKTYAAAILLEDDGERTNYKLNFEKERVAA